MREVVREALIRAVTDFLDPISATLSVRRPGEPLGAIETDESPRVLAAWFDCQELLQRTKEELAELLCRELGRRLVAGGKALPALPAEPVQRLASLLDFACSGNVPPVCVVLDEYDLLFEANEDWPAIAGVEQLFGLFRAIAQRTGRLSLAVIGRDPEYFRRPKMNGIPNPMLGWFTDHWAGPLSKNGMDANEPSSGRIPCAPAWRTVRIHDGRKTQANEGASA